MEKLEVSIAVTPTPLTEPLLSGEVVPEGITLRVEQRSVDENCRLLPQFACDITEINISTLVRGLQERLPMRALPVFTSGRWFVHAGLWFSNRAHIENLLDMRGRIAVTRQYWSPTSIWQRKVLGIIYGINPEDLSWVTLEPEYLDIPVPSILLHRLETLGRSPEELARTGLVDVCLTDTEAPPRQGKTSPIFVPAIPDLVDTVRSYYTITGVFPILHVTVVREQLVRDHPWVVESLCEAYLRAKEVARDRLQERGDGTWGLPAWMQEIVGEDPWPYGISANQKAILGFLAAARYQGLVLRRLETEDLFVPGVPEALQ